MKVKPVAKTSRRHLVPTAAEAIVNPDLLRSAVPRTPLGAGAMFGAGLLGSLAFQSLAAAQPEPLQAPAAMLDAGKAEQDADAATKAEAARRSVATLVAPILQKALDEDGRGAFGCVAVDPPTMLSENEALNLIEQEFAKAGVKLRDCYELSGFTQSRTDWTAERKPRGKGEEDEWRFAISGDGDPARPKRIEPGSWVFDFASEDGTLLVEFLSEDDHSKLEDKNRDFMSTGRSYDFPRRATRFRDDLATRTNGAPVTVALFFDPLTSV